MKFIFIFIFIHFTFVFYSQEIFGTCLGKSFVVEKNIWTKSPLVNLETREIKIFFSDSSISRLYAVRLSPSNFRSRIYLQKDKNLLMNSSKLIKRLNATVIINAGFYDRNYRPMGFFRSGTKTYNSRILFKGSRRSLHFGALLHFHKQTNRIQIYHRDFFNKTIPGDALQAGPYLFKNGRPVKGLRKYREFNRADRRTVVSILKDRTIVILVNQENDRGVSWCELQKLFTNSKIGFSVKDAINLDGGASSQLSIRSANFKKNIFGRPVPAFVVFYKN